MDGGLRIFHFLQQLIGGGKQRVPHRAEGRGVSQVALGKPRHGHPVMKSHGRGVDAMDHAFLTHHLGSQQAAGGVISDQMNAAGC